MEEQQAPSAEPKPGPPKRRTLWIAIAVVVVIVVVLLAAVLGGLFAGAKPQAIFFVGYPGEGDKLVPTWWSNRAQWPAQWLYSEGLQDISFMGRLKTAGVDVTSIEGTAPTAPISPDYNTSSGLFNTEYQAAFGRAPKLYGPNSYDAMFTLALAFQKAQTTDTNSSAFKAALRAVANPPGIAIRPGEWAKAAANITNGIDIDYQGASGAINYDQFGEVGSDYEAWSVNASAGINQKLFIPEGSWSTSSVHPAVMKANSLPVAPAAPPTNLPVGTLFDLTGPLKDFGPDQQNGTVLAATDINSAGGITIGTTVYNIQLYHEDDGTDATKAAAAATKLVTVDGVKALIGGTASSASAAAFAVIAPAGIIEITSSSTSPVFTTADTTDQFWRTAPSDALQGKAAGWYAFTQRGWRIMSVLYVDNAYGRGLSGVFAADFKARGGQILRLVPFPEDPAKVDANSILQTLFTPGSASYIPIATWRTEEYGPTLR